MTASTCSTLVTLLPPAISEGKKPGPQPEAPTGRPPLQQGPEGKLAGRQQTTASASGCAVTRLQLASTGQRVPAARRHHRVC